MISRRNKKKKFHDYHCRKYKKRRRRKYVKKARKEKNQRQKQVSVSKYKYMFVVPSVFSIIDNTEETLLMFANIQKGIEGYASKSRIFIDSANVEKVTVDALVYLIAVMTNNKLGRKKYFVFEGNFPTNEFALQVYRTSGFMEFVYSRMKKLPKNTEKMQIITGKYNEPISAKRVCEFAMERLQAERIDVINIQKILIELMSNVFAHAYKEDGIMEPCWYLYAEYILPDTVRIVFADTGLGITKTVRKKFHEKIFGRKDCDLLFSAFSTEEFRTETREKNRGNGLPGIKKILASAHIKNFSVITGKGELKSKKSKREIFEKIEHSNRINGTIYMFDFVK